MKHILILTALAFAPQTFAADPAPVAAVAASREMHVGVKGMVCAFCAQGIEKKFKAQKEVEAVKVSLEKKFVHLTFKEGQRLSKEEIAEILKDAGYEADFGGGQ